MAIWQKHRKFTKFTKKLYFNTWWDPEKNIFHEIYSICVYIYWKKSKNAKLIPWLDMKLVKKSKNAKLIPWLDMKILKKIQKCKINSLTWYENSEKIQNPKINSLTWYDFIEFSYFRGPNYLLKYRFSMKNRIFDIVIILR